MNKKIVQLILGISFGFIIVFMVGYILQTTFFSKSKPVTETLPIADQKFEQVIAETEKLDYNGEFAQAAATLEVYVASDPPSDQKKEAKIKLASAYINDKQYDKAIILYEEQRANKDQYQLSALHGLAHIYVRKGDNKKAIEYFKLAIEYAKQNGNDTLVITTDEAAIASLEKEQ